MKTVLNRADTRLVLPIPGLLRREISLRCLVPRNDIQGAETSSATLRDRLSSPSIAKRSGKPCA